jgi:FtsP/CotA-like multicopper oxidase with cupredoxin domain
MDADDARIGSVYRKALYRGYTDAQFDTPMPSSPDWAHLGALGPPIVAEVGDTIVVNFRNRSSLHASVHPHGVSYDKDSEGAPYADGTQGEDRADDAVPPGGEHVYTWYVPERAGPAPGEPSSVLWMYHSHTDEVADTYAGLIGPMVVTARGKARTDGTPKDVDRQFVTLFHVYDENHSQYLADNAATYANVTDPMMLGALAESEDFVESNLMHTINGYVYGNVPGLTMSLGERVRWYAIGMGTEIDIHTPHWHGATVVSHGMRTDAITLLPGLMTVADMVPDSSGTWLYHCHVNDHINAGMVAVYTVAP